MSRRRDPKPAASIPGITLPVVCTGRLTHQRWSFGSVLVLPDDRVITKRLRSVPATVARVRGGNAINLDAKVDERQYALNLDELDSVSGVHKTFTFNCHRCTQAVSLTEARFAVMAVQIAGAGGALLDVSALWAANVT